MAPARKFTDEMRAWVARHVKEGGYAELTDRFNKRFDTTVGERSLQTLCYRMGLRNSDRMTQIRWTAQHTDWIRAHVAGRSFDELAEMFNRHFNMRVKSRAFKSYCHRHGLHNGMRGFNEATRRTQFRAGTAPWNKGVKGVIKPNGGSFRKGNPSPHQKPVGTMVWNNRYGAWFVKTAEPNKWRSAARVVWERANGRALGPRMVVIHADGDKSNLAPENLVAMTAAEWTSLFKNGLRVPGDADLTKCGAALVRLRFAVKRREGGSCG